MEFHFFEAQVVSAQSTLQQPSNVTTRFILSNKQEASPCGSYSFWYFISLAHSFETPVIQWVVRTNSFETSCHFSCRGRCSLYTSFLFPVTITNSVAMLKFPNLFTTFALLLILIPFSSFSLVSAVTMCGLKPPKSREAATSPSTTSQSIPAPYNNGTIGCQINGTVTQQVVITGWYPGWLASSVPPSSLSWDKWTHLTYSFACVSR